MKHALLYLLVTIFLATASISCIEEKIDGAVADVEETCRMLVLEAQDDAWDACTNYYTSVVLPVLEQSIEELLNRIELLLHGHDRDAVLGGYGCITDGNDYWNCNGTELCPSQ